MNLLFSCMNWLFKWLLPPDQKRKKEEHTGTVFNNKIYENFSFGGPGPTADSVKHEECIYEN